MLLTSQKLIIMLKKIWKIVTKKLIKLILTSSQIIALWWIIKNSNYHRLEGSKYDKRYIMFFIIFQLILNYYQELFLNCNFIYTFDL